MSKKARRRVPDAVRDFRKRFSRRRSKGEMADKQRDVIRAGTPQDVTSPRAKSQGHGKVTADRWNQ
jgi:hypothetical protein